MHDGSGNKLQNEAARDEWLRRVPDICRVLNQPFKVLNPKPQTTKPWGAHQDLSELHGVGPGLLCCVSLLP
jgi:hypothetical protein